MNFAGNAAAVVPVQISNHGLQTIKLNVAGIRISAYFETNTGPPLLLLHGNSSTKAVWLRQFDLVRKMGRTILAPDLPGHGESGNSPTPATTYSFPGYAAVITALLDRLGLSSADVIGWSLGGHIGLQLLSTDKRVRSLLIAGTPPAPLCLKSLDSAFYSSEDMMLAGKENFSAADAVAYGTAMMGGRESLPAALLRGVKRTDGNARRCMFENALRGIGVDQRAVAESADRPLCIVHGECDPFVRLDYLRAVRYRRLWQNRIFVIAGAGHAPHWTHAAQFNGILSEFLGFVEYAGRGHPLLKP